MNYACTLFHERIIKHLDWVNTEKLKKPKYVLRYKSET